MTLWRRVKEDSDRGIRQIKTKAAAVGRRLAQESEITKRRLWIRNLEREMDESLTRLGKRVFSLSDRSGGDLFRDRQVQELVSKVEDLRKRRKGLEEEISALEEDAESP